MNISVGAPESRDDHRARIRLFNVKFSPNLGDGLLSECLERELMALGAHPDTWSVDLAARNAYGESLPGRRSLMKILDALPTSMRQAVLRQPMAHLARKKWRPHYHSGLECANAVVIGGGNLFQDIDLNFPTKLTAAFGEAGHRDLPTVVYGVGVTSRWTRQGERMFRNAVGLAPLKAVYVRDPQSKQAWDRTLAFASGHEAVVVRDPGLVACDHYAARPSSGSTSPRIGLGIMSQIAIRYHADNAPTAAELDGWYVDLTRRLLQRGFRVTAFTNGSPEDRVYLSGLRPALKRLDDNDAVEFTEPTDPADLCGIISGLDALVAYRMHAIIAAYSYRVPAVGLAWDPKLRSFMTSVDRADYLLDIPRDPATRCAALVDRCLADSIPERQHREVIDEARAGVSKLYLSLMA